MLFHGFQTSVHIHFTSVHVLFKNMERFFGRCPCAFWVHFRGVETSRRCRELIIEHVPFCVFFVVLPFGERDKLVSNTHFLWWGSYIKITAFACAHHWNVVSLVFPAWPLSLSQPTVLPIASVPDCKTENTAEVTTGVGRKQEKVNAPQKDCDEFMTYRELKCHVMIVCCRCGPP